LVIWPCRSIGRSINKNRPDYSFAQWAFYSFFKVFFAFLINTLLVLWSFRPNCLVVWTNSSVKWPSWWNNLFGQMTFAVKWPFRSNNLFSQINLLDELNSAKCHLAKRFSVKLLFRPWKNMPIEFAFEITVRRKKFMTIIGHCV
jgi:hypothetical protein